LFRQSRWPALHWKERHELGDPYDAPTDATIRAAVSPIPLLWSVVVVFGCAALGGLLGLGIGAGLGACVPGYYRSLFRAGGDPQFDPIAVGIGQGLTQGLVFGGIIGLLLVAMWYWHQARAPRRSLT
jgi:hypothetical protein